MPYYRWKGINLFGDAKRGKSFARSEDDLDSLLFDRNIAMLSCKNCKIWSFLGSISNEDKINFFRQLSVLLESGVRLPDALRILGEQSENILFGQIVFALESDIQEGVSFGDALGKHPQIFDDLMVKMANVGQESGNLGSSLKQLTSYLEIKQDFRKKLRSASALPMITLAFFVFITMSIFVFVVPKFADIFRTMNKELPTITRVILKISEFLRSYQLFIGLGILVAFIFLARKYIKKPVLQPVVEMILVRFPLTGSLIKQTSLVYFLRSVSMLLQSGMRLLPAIEITKKSFESSLLKNHLEMLQQDVYAGSSLSQSMTDYPGLLFSQDLVAMVKVGEETGSLGLMLQKAADMYQDKVDRSILFFTTIFQPLLMICLGLLIALLIFAIYIPVFSMADVV